MMGWFSIQSFQGKETGVARGPWNIKAYPVTVSLHFLFPFKLSCSKQSETHDSADLVNRLTLQIRKLGPIEGK